jgi:hypothetical protein
MLKLGLSMRITIANGSNGSSDSSSDSNTTRAKSDIQSWVATNDSCWTLKLESCIG